jgi:hypothetical protein
MLSMLCGLSEQHFLVGFEQGASIAEVIEAGSSKYTVVFGATMYRIACSTNFFACFTELAPKSLSSVGRRVTVNHLVTLFTCERCREQ